MSMDDIFLVLSGCGAGVIVPMLAKGLFEWLTGRQKREREGWKLADQEARLRRDWEIYAHGAHRAGVIYGFAHLLPRMPGDIRHLDSASSGMDPPRE